MKAIKFYALFLMLIGGQAFSGSIYSSNLDSKARIMQQNARMLLSSIHYANRYNYARHDIKKLIRDTRKFRRALRYGQSRYALVSKFRQIKSDFYRIQRKMSRLNRHGYNHQNRYSRYNRYNRYNRVQRNFNRLSRSFKRFKRTANRVVYNRNYRNRGRSGSYSSVYNY